MPAEIISPSPPRCCARTVWVIAPMGSSRRFTCWIPMGRMEETETRFCSPIPALRSASSKAFRSEILLTALPEVTKNFFGMGSMRTPSIDRSILKLWPRHRRGDIDEGLRHLMSVLAPGVVGVEEAIRAVAEATVERDGRGVRHADLEPRELRATRPAERLTRLHELAPNPLAAERRGHRHGQDAYRVGLDERHEGSPEDALLVEERERAGMMQNPGEMLPPEPTLVEAHLFEVLDRLEIVRRRGPQHGARERAEPICACRRRKVDLAAAGWPAAHDDDPRRALGKRDREGGGAPRLGLPDPVLRRARLRRPPRRERDRAGHREEGRGAGRRLRGGRTRAHRIGGGRPGHGPSGPARARRVRGPRYAVPGRLLRREVSHYRGGERGVPPRCPPPVDPLAEDGPGVAGTTHGGRRDPRVLPRGGLPADGSPDPSPPGKRRRLHGLRAGLLRPQGLPHAVLAALCGGVRPRDGESVLRRALVPCGEGADVPPPHGVLARGDGGRVGGAGLRRQPRGAAHRPRLRAGPRAERGGPDGPGAARRRAPRGEAAVPPDDLHGGRRGAPPPGDRDRVGEGPADRRGARDREGARDAPPDHTLPTHLAGVLQGR